MGEAKYEVPAGMLEAATQALKSKPMGEVLAWNLAKDPAWPGLQAIFEAAIGWLAGNSESVLGGLVDYLMKLNWSDEDIRACVSFVDRRMFRKPESAVPDAIKDLLLMPKFAGGSAHDLPDPMYARHDNDVIEAYRRGREAGE